MIAYLHDARCADQDPLNPCQFSCTRFRGPWGRNMFRSVRYELLLGSSALALFAAVGAASAQQAGQPSPTVVPPGATQIPDINVTAPRRTAARPAQRPAAAPSAPPPTPEQVQLQANQAVVQQA